MKNDNLKDRILGCLYLAGMGDAMGAPSEALSQHEILEKFNGYITTFLGPGDSFYVQGNIPGEVMDDTTQMYEMAKAVIKANGNLTVKDAAMRVAAAGLIHPGDLDEAVKTAVIMSKPSHGTQHAFAGAAAIACGIAEALKEEADVISVVKACIYGAKKGYEIGSNEARIATGADLLPKIVKSIDIAFSTSRMAETLHQLDLYVGNDGSIQSSVAAAIGTFLATKGNPKDTVIYGTNLGGDTDTIACIAGMLSGALSGLSSIDEQWKDIFTSANPSMDFDVIGEELYSIAENNKNNEK